MVRESFLLGFMFNTLGQMTARPCFGMTVWLTLLKCVPPPASTSLRYKKTVKVLKCKGKNGRISKQAHMRTFFERKWFQNQTRALTTIRHKCNKGEGESQIDSHSGSQFCGFFRNHPRITYADSFGAVELVIDIVMMFTIELGLFVAQKL